MWYSCCTAALYKMTQAIWPTCRKVSINEYFFLVSINIPRFRPAGFNSTHFHNWDIVSRMGGSSFGNWSVLDHVSHQNYRLQNYSGSVNLFENSCTKLASAINFYFWLTINYIPYHYHMISLPFELDREPVLNNHLVHSW